MLFPVISVIMNDANHWNQPEVMFTVADLEYDLPKDLIAQQPPEHRDDARLLVVDRMSGKISDRTISDLPGLLHPGDLLVFNDTRVVPAKFAAFRQTGGKVRGLFLHEETRGIWLVMLDGSRRLREGESLHISAVDEFDVALTLFESCGDGHWRVQVSAVGSAESILNRIGQTPVPPYIHRSDAQPETDRIDRSRYQTVYADKPGAIAAPTAGLHFTDELLGRIRRGGIEFAYLTLHVGEGTFKPISVDALSQHVMHAECYIVPNKTVEAIVRSQKRGGRIVAVGTTCVRVLESLADDKGALRPGSGSTDLFIYPPYHFRVVNALLTNFHLPRSTLLALVMAFAGTQPTQKTYRHAVEQKYRFYSYGDAMFIQS